jgi:uncharacterized protein YqeY
MKTAMREKDALVLGTIRMLKAAVKNAAIEKGGADAELTDPEVVAVIRREVKKRQDSFEQYQGAGRTDLAEKEEAEIAVLNRYLPEPLGEAELSAIVEAAVAELGATSRKEMGAVMKLVNERVAGRADGKTVSQAVMAKLS